MAIIRYTAKRGIPITGYNLSGNDLSMSDVDNSLNSTTTDLTGVVAGEWIKVSGFLNVFNNEWFKVSTVSTNKIVFDSSNTVTTEVAGESVLLIGYARGEGESYDLEVGLSVFNPTINGVKDHSISESGVERSVLHRIEFLYNVTLIPTPNTDNKQVDEFIQSVIASEGFEFDKNSFLEDTLSFTSVVLRGQVSTSRLGYAEEYSRTFNMVATNAIY